MSTPDEFDNDAVDTAIEYVIKHGAEDRGSTRSYSLVFDAAGMRPPQDLHFGGDGHLVTAFMKRFHDRCIERELPPLDALVVHVAGSRRDRPGAGYFQVNGFTDPFREERPRPSVEEQVAAIRFWEIQKKECRRWGELSRRGHLPHL